MEIPTNEHMNFAKRILGYTKGTIKVGLVYEKGKKSAYIHGYRNSNFARDVSDYQSTSG